MSDHARSLPPGSDSEDLLDQDDDYGFYHGHRAYTIRLRELQFKTPDRSSAIPGGINLYSTRTFTIGRRESVVLPLGFDLIIPADSIAIITSREVLLREYGLECHHSIFGSGETVLLKCKVAAH